MNLSNNQLSGAIPAGLTSGANFKILNLSDNKLSGNIPASFFNKENYLTDVRLNNNLLTGPFPNLDDAFYLKYLFLDHNKLSGEIPS